MLHVDLSLAILHHLLVFGLAIMLAVEIGRVRPGLAGADIVALSRLDAGYGAAAGAVILVGVLRVIYGVKGWGYYQPNPWFWAKMGSFLLVGLLSLPPTLTFFSWRRAQAADPDFAPTAQAIAGVRRWLMFEVLGFALIVGFAATMARLG